MRWLRLLFRIFGWLLTPLLAWAASFFGAVGGALIAMRMSDPVRGLIVTAIFGGVAGFLAIIGWLRYLRRSPEVREALAVTEDGTPDTTELRNVGLVLIAACALAPRAEAQAVVGSVGRFYDAGDWTSYRFGFSAAKLGIFGLQVHSDVFQRTGAAEAGFAGLGADLTAFQSSSDGPYAMAGVGAGLGSATDDSYSKGWTSWSVGGGYQVFPASFLSMALEGRWRAVSLGRRDGFELAATFGFHLRRRPALDRVVPPLASPPAPAPLPAPIMLPAVPASPSDHPSAAASSSTATLSDSIVATATAAMGRPYQRGGTGADSSGFDCSGLIQYAFGQHGIALPRRSVDQARAGTSVPKRMDALRPGDLLTFSNRGNVVTHVGLYLGDGRFVHSATRGVQVSLLSANDPYGRWWHKRWVGVRRILD